MKIGVFSSKSYDEQYLIECNGNHGFTLEFLESRLNHETMALTAQYDAISVFVNDVLDKTVLDTLKANNVEHIALRCAGFNNVNLKYAREIGISVSRVPAYSPQAVAEHTVGLMMTLNRKFHKAFNRVKENNFSLDGLIGFNFYGKCVGVIGTGKIGKAVIQIMLGLGCKVLCYDPYPDESLPGANCQYVSLDTLLAESDIITLHCPLSEENQHMIDYQSIDMMKPGVMLINTSRGALINSKAIIAALKSKKIGYLGLDVYEMESELFFEDHSFEIMQDDVFDRLSGFPNVVITGHQGFFTHEALTEIARTTLQNLQYFFAGKVNVQTFL